MTPNENSPEAWYGMQAGTVLASRYRVERLISRGGMGAVFEATQLGLDRSVAVKMLLPALSRDEKVQERFRREAKSAASLQHPNIIQIYDYGISDHGPYIVMEFLRGKSLRQILRGGPCEFDYISVLIDQISSAVSAAHNAGIIHRDLKPDNIIVEEHSGGGVVVKVLDFGIAKMREAQNDDTDQNLTGANIIGSPAYMSPEQSMGLDLDPRSDIYSLGIILYELISGSTPFGKASTPAMLVHQVNSQPKPLSELRSDISDAVADVVMKSLAKDREQRFATATEFARALRLAVDDPGAYVTIMTGDSTLDAADAYATNPNTDRRITTDHDSSTVTLRRRLAILPLRNLAGDPEIEFMGFALADSIITQLAPIKSLIVRPSSSVEKYRNQSIDPRTLGRELQVDTILSGSYLKAGDMFRINAQLVDVQQNEILWQEQIDLKFDNIIALQDRICDELIRGLRLNVTTGEQEVIKRDEARNPLAYEFYLRGLAFGNSPDEHRQAIEMLKASIGLEPNYAPAWSALAGRYINARGYLGDETMFEKAEEATRKALELNPDLPSAFFWLGVYYGENGDLKNALMICRQLLQVAPNSEYAYQMMGHAYDYAGLPDIALTLFRKANEINPMTYPYMIGFIQYQKGNLVEARGEFEACPDTYKEKQYWLSVIDLVEGMPEESIKRLESLTSSGNTGWFYSAMNALLCAIKGEKEKGIKILDEAISVHSTMGSYYYYISAEVYAQLGAIEKSLEMLRNTVRTGYGNYPFLIKDPMLSSLHSHQDFSAIAKDMQNLQSQVQLMLVTGAEKN